MSGGEISYAFNFLQQAWVIKSWNMLS